MGSRQTLGEDASFVVGCFCCMGSRKTLGEDASVACMALPQDKQSFLHA